MPQASQKELKNLNVFVRVKPLQNTILDDVTSLNLLSDTEISIKSRDEVQKNTFTFDRVFNQTCSQETIYQGVAKQIVNKSFHGINGTIFCYGQTSSGKTYTCIGPDFKDQQKKGILPRIIQQMLYRIRQRQKNVQSNIKISMIQIYNEKINDLLAKKKKFLKIRSNKTQGIYLQQVTEKYILSLQEAHYYIMKGISSRSVGATNMNKISSRSHMMFILTLQQHDFYSGQARLSKITIADLAGSQKISKSGSQGRLIQETKKINTSLSTLGKVIHLLSEGRYSHIPYRDSKLTRLLQQSLGGNSITNLIINISPSYIDGCETLMSLRFGFRAKQIKNQPKINIQYTIPQLLQLLGKAEKRIKQQNQIINDLRKNHMHYKTFDQLSQVVKQEENSQDYGKKKSTQQSFILSGQDRDYPNNHSTQSFFQSQQNKNNCLSPMKVFSAKKYSNQPSPNGQLKFSMDLKPKFSLKQISMSCQEQSIIYKSLQIASEVCSVIIPPYKQKEDQKNKISKPQNLKRESRLQLQRKRDVTIDENLKEIRKNLAKIKSRHLKFKDQSEKNKQILQN